MPDPVASQPPLARSPRPNPLTGLFWPIAIFVAVMLYIQWPAVKDLYYQISGAEPPKSTIPWREDFEAALQEVRSSDKPMLLVFSASWCGPCNAMKREVWADRKIEESVTAGFVPMHIDVDDAKHTEVTERYGIRSIPAVFVLDADGDVLARESYMSQSEALAFLDSSSGS